MDVYDEEFIRFWSALNKNNVEYIMVGGVATNLNGYLRATDDADIWIKDSIDNRKNLRLALHNYCNIDYFMIETMQFVPGWTNFNLNNGTRLDIMIDMKGLEGFGFDECLQAAQKADIDGVIVPFLHINHLIQNKKAVNRPKDQLDVIYLEKIKKILEEEEQRNQSKQTK
jgi:hypothetical protein